MQSGFSLFGQRPMALDMAGEQVDQVDSRKGALVKLRQLDLGGRRLCCLASTGGAKFK